MKSYNLRIRELREDADKTQVEIAELLKTTQSYYGQYERGLRPFPIEHLITLCKFYNVSADYILGFTDKIVPLPKK
ncbi:MAG: helix-turn-helix transcriptional regulator [Ruminococcaceae bacterium]|nr:helix-turn-helix transcriptional regulator [Oscillospiraceae bacterium]